MENKKGFTLIELLATITMMGILVSMAVVSMVKYIDKAKETVYKDYEETLKDAAASYYLNNTGLLPRAGSSEKATVTATALIDQGYLDDMRDPKNDSLDCNNASYVTVTRNADVDFNMDLEYRVCLVCSKYKSSSCEG